MEVDEAEVEEIDAPQMPNKQGKKPVSRQANAAGGAAKRVVATTVARGKGKAKIEPPPRRVTSTKQENTTSEVVLMDEMEGIEGVEIELKQSGRQVGTAKTRQIHVKKKEGEQAVLQKQLDRAHEKLLEVRMI